MRGKTAGFIAAAAAIVMAYTLGAQEPPNTGVPPVAARPHDTNKPAPAADEGMTPAAIAASKQDPAAVDRGGKLFRASCAGCHGATAKGGGGAPNLVRSLVVLDDEKGNKLGPLVRQGRVEQGMPKFNFNDEQVSDLAAWLHVRTFAAGHRTTYAFRDVLTGNVEGGRKYFEGHCASCHANADNFAALGKKYDPFTLQQRWLQPRRDPHDKPADVTVTFPDGRQVTGKLDYIDDFTVSLRTAKGEFESYPLDSGIKATVSDPLKAHTDMLLTYTDADIHNVTAYLSSLK